MMVAQRGVGALQGCDSSGLWSMRVRWYDELPSGGWVVWILEYESGADRFAWKLTSSIAWNQFYPQSVGLPVSVQESVCSYPPCRGEPFAPALPTDCLAIDLP